jgi:hypothetical protein
MNKRTINIIILSLIVVLLLGGIIYFVFLFKMPKANPGTASPTPINNTNLPSSGSSTPIVKQAEIVKNQNIKPATSEEVSRFNLEKIAASFAERLGSYSNQSNFSNIVDLKIFMTLSMQKWADKYIADAQKNSKYAGIYQGVTTKAVSEETKSYSENPARADILVHTQKVQSSGTAENSTIYNEDVLITFVKESDQWKVDNAKWQGKK